MKYKKVKSNGYYVLFIPEHPNSFGRGYIYEHRYIIEQKIGRYLSSKEIVHHIDENNLNNEITNLELLPSIAYHKLKHRSKNCNHKHPDEENILIFCKCGCFKVFYKYDKYGRPREYIYGSHKKKLGAKKYRIELIKCLCGCNKTINKYDKYGRMRKYIAGHNNIKK